MPSRVDSTRKRWISLVRLATSFGRSTVAAAIRVT
jgi:hypothetical protein